MTSDAGSHATSNDARPKVANAARVLQEMPVRLAIAQLTALVTAVDAIERCSP